MTVMSHPTEGVVEEVGNWLTGEFSGRLPGDVIDRVIRMTRKDLEGRIAPEELAEMLHRLGRSRLHRMLEAPAETRIPRTR
jgi:hypothetical protein